MRNEQRTSQPPGMNRGMAGRKVKIYYHEAQQSHHERPNPV